MESILVTGCLGFIGSHVLEELLDTGSKIVGVDAFTYAANESFYHSVKDKCEIQKVDICNTEAINDLVIRHKVKRIVNLAAETHVDNSIKSASEFLKTNLLGVHSLLEVTKKNDIELVQFSTDEVYGSAKFGISFDELSPIKPQNPYSASKASADLLIRSYKNTYGIAAKILRPSNNFGPRQHAEKFLSKVVSHIRENRKIPVYGDGKQVRQWTYVKDTARVVRKLVENEVEFDVVNITSGYEIENLKALTKVCLLLNKNAEEFIEHVEDRPGHDLRYSILSNKLHNLIEFKFMDFDAALKSTVLEI